MKKMHIFNKSQFLLIAFIMHVVVCLGQEEIIGNVAPKSWKHLNDCTIEDFEYKLYIDTITNKRYAMASYIGYATNVKFKSNVKFEKNSYTVEGVFASKKRNKLIKEVKLPGTVKFINIASFRDCLELTDIEIPNVNRIASETFAGCKSLEHISAPQLKEIHAAVFADCENLRSVSLDKIEKIYVYGFVGCTNLKWISGGDKLEMIGMGAFRDCENFVSIGDDLAKGIKLPSIKYLGHGVFDGCKSIKNVEIGLELSHLGDGIFSECENLQSVRIRTDIKNIPRNSFNQCKNLSELHIPSSLDSIHIGAFQNCFMLKEIGTEHHTPKYIGSHAFFGCKNMLIDSFHFNFAELDTIRQYTFYGCESLEDVFIHNVKYIGKSAFEDCKSMKSIFSAKSVNFIGESAFRGCTALINFYDLGDNQMVDFEDNSFRKGLYGVFSGSGFDYVPIERSYKYFVTSTLKNLITSWQEKKEYESTSQWRERVTEETRNSKIEIYRDSLKNEYIKRFAPSVVNGSIKSYDADAEMFKIVINNVNSYRPKNSTYDRILGEQIYLYAKVPRGDAPKFREQWNTVKMEPIYCITKDYLGIASCKFKLDGKTYDSPILYDDETANVELNLSPLDIWKDNQPLLTEEKYDDTLDKNIPKTATTNNMTFVVIIGNEFYKEVSKVSYAQNDAKVFAEYCQKTLGVPQQNIRNYQNATYAMMLSAIKDMKSISEAYNGDVNFIFYYCGHGVPNEKTHEAYLLPIDANPSDIETCYPISRLYTELGKMSANRIIVFMDACFSGAQRGEGMLVEARGVAIKAKSATPQGNMVVFSAASGDETAYPYKEKGHGMFTYFLLKKLNETKGNVTLGELGNYITTQVKQQSVVVNRKSQTPTVVPSSAMNADWQNWKLK